MSWRTVVISRSAKLDYQMGYIVVRSSDETKRVFLRDIRMLLVESPAVTITSALINELIKHRIKVIFCDEKRNPSSELMPYYGSHDCSGKIRMQIAWSESVKKKIWTEIVTEKIRKQAELLSEKSLSEAGLLYDYINEIQLGDESNREGHASKVYFNALFGQGFSRTLDCFENAALNYGYSIILSSFTREIVTNGYLTQIGLYHDNQDNPFNLASDLMEPFRPLVDRQVSNMKLNKFEREEKMMLIDVVNQKVIINDRSEYVANAIQIYCKSVFDAINHFDVSEISYYQNEL